MRVIFEVVVHSLDEQFQVYTKVCKPNLFNW